MTDCLIDGKPGHLIPADDRGLLYGDHLFETIAFHRGSAPLWSWHWQRLVKSCAILGYSEPDEATVRSECASLCPVQGWAVIRLTVTRGSGGRAYFPPEQPVTRRIVQKRAWPNDLEVQRTAGLVMTTSPVRLATGSVVAGLKHGNRLEQVLAARACAAANSDEALLFDHLGRLVEAIASCVVVELNGAALTPPAGRGVDGVGLAWLRSQHAVDIQEAELDMDDIRAASGLMVINSVAGIRPASSLDGRPLNPSARCRLWQQLWNERLS
ncbi:MAG: aminotransferase class IV [Wenzhouxiangella sp.]